MCFCAQAAASTDSPAVAITDFFRNFLRECFGVLDTDPFGVNGFEFVLRDWMKVIQDFAELNEKQIVTDNDMFADQIHNVGSE